MSIEINLLSIHLNQVSLDFPFKTQTYQLIRTDFPSKRENTRVGASFFVLLLLLLLLLLLGLGGTGVHIKKRVNYIIMVFLGPFFPPDKNGSEKKLSTIEPHHPQDTQLFWNTIPQ